MKIIGISGTPGVGKSSIATELSKLLGLPRIDLSKEVIERGLYVEYDEHRRSYVIDEDAVRRYLARLYDEIGPYILDSHYAELAPKHLVELVFVVRLDPAKLIDRLLARGWPASKVAENVEAELLSVPTLNAIEELGEELVVEIDATNRDIASIAREIVDILFGERPAFLGHTIDWLETMPRDRLERVLRFVEMHRS